MSIDTAFQLLSDANPVPNPASLRSQPQDSAVFLAAIQRRSTEMQTQEETIDTPSQEARSRRPRVWLAAAAALIVVVVTIGLVFSLGTDAPPADQGPDADAVAVVEAAYAAFNAGDAGAWLAAAWPGLEINEPGQDFGLGDIFAATAAADAQIDIVSCVSMGFGDWPEVWSRFWMRVNSTDGEDATAGYLVTCETTETNAFYRAGGVEGSWTTEWVVVDGAVAASTFDGDFAVADAFNLDFRNWLATNHKEVSFDYETFPWMFPMESSVPTALEYVDEFVEFSPDWPRS